MNIGKYFLLGITLIWTNNILAQSAHKPWAEYDESNNVNQQRWVIPEKYRAVALDFTGTSEVLLALEQDQQISFTIEIPLPDGRNEVFEIHRSDVMSDILRANHPDIATYKGRSTNDEHRNIYMDITPAGIHAMIIGGGPSVFIDPYFRSRADTYVSYYKGDFGHSLLRGWTCEFEEDNSKKSLDPAQQKEQVIKFNKRRQKAALVTRRYRLAVATTGEYTALFGGTVEGGLAAVVTAINRVTGIYETEVGVTFTLVPDNNRIIYTNAANDPFFNNSGDINRVQAAIDGQVGNANYDIGHVFTSSNGGVASLGVVCNNGFKARGLTGLPNPTGDPFYVDYVAHEIGHQFAGLHTFNGDSNACAGGQRSPSAAYEPGSGSTIMAYAGICGNDNLQNNSDAYFHLKSLMDITNLINGSAAGCAENIDNGNNMPTADANVENIDGKTIPASTPFELTGDGSDPDGSQQLTYQWDQWDLGPRKDLSAPDDGGSGLFRSYFATSSKTRTFPRLSDIINNTSSINEILPTTSRTMNFQLVVRDNAGGWMNDQITLNVSNAAGPFLVTSQNSNGTYWDEMTVTWDVAGTTGNDIDCADVDILMSVDGGQSYPYTLADNTDNDGTELVDLPNMFASQVRIKVKCSDNVFFDINNADLELRPANLPCNTTAQVDDIPIIDGIYSSSALLTGSGTVPTGGEVIFTGATEVHLLEQFQVDNTGLFQAAIEPCTN